jgi:hypothetical protein
MLNEIQGGYTNNSFNPNDYWVRVGTLSYDARAAAYRLIINDRSPRYPLDAGVESSWDYVFGNYVAAEVPEYKALCDALIGKYALVVSRGKHEGKNETPLLIAEIIGWSKYDGAQPIYSWSYINGYFTCIRKTNPESFNLIYSIINDINDLIQKEAERLNDPSRFDIFSKHYCIVRQHSPTEYRLYDLSSIAPQINTVLLRALSTTSEDIFYLKPYSWDQSYRIIDGKTGRIVDKIDGVSIHFSYFDNELSISINMGPFISEKIPLDLNALPYTVL